ncbi:hypothetical protein BBJ66_08380 [Rhizobium sp. RSm-3]|nr:hypothetical protein BBJ66_08380 [Rhizobium sp. RSm-3]
MEKSTVGASRRPHSPAGTFSLLGRRECRAVSFTPSPLGEKVPEGRMRGLPVTTFPFEGLI